MFSSCVRLDGGEPVPGISVGEHSGTFSSCDVDAVCLLFYRTCTVLAALFKSPVIHWQQRRDI